MTLKAVLIGFNDTLFHSEPLRRQLWEEVLWEQGYELRSGEYDCFLLGQADREGLAHLWHSWNQPLAPALHQQLWETFAQRYRTALDQGRGPALFPDAGDFLFRLRLEQLPLALVTRSARWEVDYALGDSPWFDYFSVLVTAEDAPLGKPDPWAYHMAIDRLNAQHPDLQVRAKHCLAVEDSPAGFEAAHQAGIAVVGVAHTLPLHMVQRQVEWGIDRLLDLELIRVKAEFASPMGSTEAGLNNAPDRPDAAGPPQTLPAPRSPQPEGQENGQARGTR
ncbi:MAG: HAD family hydrolase [Prochlorothrix sp.]|nr:HAD family phosphatase [Prochlorothrix sp.]